MVKRCLLQRLLAVTCCLAFLVIALGAYTRLTDAGLGCPDWPGCYGHLSVPQATAAIPVVAKKAWSEMIHRYFAGTLGVLIFLSICWGLRLGVAKRPLIALLCLLIYQPILGMWTVTWKLAPFIVSQHLLGGMAILALLFLSYLIVKHPLTDSVAENRPPMVYYWVLLGIFLLYLQMALGAWTSTNYAAISCPDFPFCQLTAWHYDFHHAFKLMRPIGPDYDGGLLSLAAKKTIQMTHRFGALVLSLYWIILAAFLILKKYHLVFLVLGLLVTQLCLGIANVVLARPLMISLLHNLTAACLLLATIRLAFYIHYQAVTQRSH